MDKAYLSESALPNKVRTALIRKIIPAIIQKTSKSAHFATTSKIPITIITIGESIAIKPFLKTFNKVSE